MKKTFKLVGILILLLIVFRGNIYRLLVNYNEIGIRTGIKITNIDLVERIDNGSIGRIIDFKEIILIANEITNDELRFSTKPVSNNPNELINTKLANCVGYSAMFNSITNYLIDKNGMKLTMKIHHCIGRLSIFGVDLHQFTKSSFFKDHDYNKIINLETGKELFIDPSISDYLRINRISSK